MTWMQAETGNLENRWVCCAGWCIE